MVFNIKRHCHRLKVLVFIQRRLQRQPKNGIALQVGRTKNNKLSSTHCGPQYVSPSYPACSKTSVCRLYKCTQDKTHSRSWYHVIEAG